LIDDPEASSGNTFSNLIAANRQSLMEKRHPEATGHRMGHQQFIDWAFRGIAAPGDDIVEGRGIGRSK
jgi:hypothetical protein